MLNVLFVFLYQYAESDECEQCIEYKQFVAELITVEPCFRILLQDKAEERGDDRYQRYVFIPYLLLHKDTEGK